MALNLKIRWLSVSFLFSLEFMGRCRGWGTDTEPRPSHMTLNLHVALQNRKARVEKYNLELERCLRG